MHAKTVTWLALIYLVVLSMLLFVPVVSAITYKEWTLLDTDDFEGVYEDWVAYNTYGVATWQDNPAQTPYHGVKVMRTCPEIDGGDDEVGDVGMTKNFTAPEGAVQINFTGYIKSNIYRDGSEAGYNGSFISVDGVLLWDNFITPAAMAPNLGTNLTFWYWQKVEFVVNVESEQTINVKIGSRCWQAQPTSGMNEPRVLLDWVNVYSREQDFPVSSQISNAVSVLPMFWFIGFLLGIIRAEDKGDLTKSYLFFLTVAFLLLVVSTLAFSAVLSDMGY